MTLIMITGIIALLTTGLFSGILLGHRLGTCLALPRIPDSSFVQFQQTMHSSYVRLMPPLQIIAILSTWALALELRSSVAMPTFVALMAAAIGAVITFGITMTVNMPVNKKLMTWNAAAPPADVREIWRPWDKGNTVRTIIAVLVFLLEVLAVSLAMAPGV